MACVRVLLYQPKQSTPQPTNEEEVIAAKAAAEKAKEESRRAIETANAHAATRIAAAENEAKEKVDVARRDADAEVKSARERADRLVADADANANDAIRKRVEAEKKQKEAEAVAADALNVARKEFEDEKALASAERLKAAKDQEVAQATTSKAQEEINNARNSVTEAMLIKDHAENTAKIEIANAEEAKRKQCVAERSRRNAIISTAVVVLIAAGITIFCLQHAAVAITNAAAANRELAEYKTNFDELVATAIKKAEVREAEAAAAIVATAEARQKALDEQKAANDARAAALNEQKIAAETREQLLRDRENVANRAEIADREKTKALEDQRIAKEAQESYATSKRVADAAKSRADQTMIEAQRMKAETQNEILAKTQEAERKVAIAEEKAGKERERRMGVEAMIKAGAPIQFPLEDNERGHNERQQRLAPNPPVSQSATPLPGYANPLNPEKRTTKEILHDVVWRWCLEGELGIENESGKLVGEVTGKPRKGYRESNLGSLLAERWNETMHEFPLGAGMLAADRASPNRKLINWHPGTEKNEVPLCPCHHAYIVAMGKRGTEKDARTLGCNAPGCVLALERRNTLRTGGVTQELWENVMGNDPNQPDDEPVPWGEWEVFLTKRNEKKEELGVPPLGYSYSFPINEVHRHTAGLTRRFMLSQTQVTQELWESVMGNNPSRFKGANRPVENVSWIDCQLFIAKLNGMREELGVPVGYIFTLPMEAEWEHACRAGTTTPFYFGSILDGEQANCDGNYPFGTFEKGRYLGGTSEAGKYPANLWGLYDMHGNVWEWCQDAVGYGPQYVQGRTSLLDGFYRSLRGGSWNTFAEYCRSAYRSRGNPMERHDDVGFRLCLAGNI